MEHINVGCIFPFESLKFREIDGIPGLITAISQDYETNEILMIAYINKEALQKTLQTGVMHYYSTSRKKLWMKGEQSGNTQDVREIYIDCDGDALLFKIKQKGGACHKGYRTCFFRKFKDGKLDTTEEKIFDPGKVY